MHVKLKKKFGQNFLVDKNISNKIFKLIPPHFNSIIEIGPGIGHLTDILIQKELKKITIIEIDRDFIPILEDKYKGVDYLKIINKDILEIPLYNFDKANIIISNLPYNISSQVLIKISNYYHFEVMILMFQKEFAEKLISNKLNTLNSIICCFYDIKKGFNISKNSFFPQPKIESTVLVFNKKNKSLISKKDIQLYSNFKSMIFVNKRKKISTILKKHSIDYLFSDLYDKRAEELSLKEFINIFIILKPKLVNKFS